MKRILVIWLAGNLVGSGMYLFMPHLEERTVGLWLYSSMLLVGLISFFIMRKEPNPKNKPIFANFAAFFVAGSLQFLHLFVGQSFLVDVPFISFYSYQYIALLLLPLLQAISLVYIVIDTFFRDLATGRKYGISLIIAGSLFVYYYSPVIIDPQYLYKTADITDFRVIDKAYQSLSANSSQVPTAIQISGIIELPAWENTRRVGVLFEGEKLRRVEQILPYLAGNNYVMLIYRPLYINNILMGVLGIFFILLFFGYQYKKDPPQGAYIEKIIFMFLPYTSFEALHYYFYVNSVQYETFQEFVNVGHYLTLANLIILAIFFSLRLSFIRSIKGEFYERELVLDSEHISRWRDGIDNLVVRHFLNPKTIHGRLFAPREAKPRT